MSEYAVSDDTRKLIESRYKRHGPSGDSPERHGVVMDATVAFALVLVRVCPPSAELTKALDHLETAQWAANAAIARHEQC